MFHEIPGEVSGGTAGGPIFVDAIVFAAHASSEIGLLVRLGAEDEDVLGLRTLHQLEVPLSLSTRQRLRAPRAFSGTMMAGRPMETSCIGQRPLRPSSERPGTREIGVRMALGAQTRDVHKMIEEAEIR